LVLPIVRLDGCPSVSDVDVLVPPTDLKDFTLVTTSVKRVVAMPNSTLRNCFQINVFGSNLCRCIKWGLVAVGLTISASPAKAEYVVNVGDVLEVAVAGVPELRNRSAVQIDGNISLPLVGMLPVAGLNLPQIQAKIGAALASKVFRQRSPDGREIAIVIDADEVTAIVAEYRPIYVDGDVSKPGQ
jgi:polysaccharide export outer membrane protein